MSTTFADIPIDKVHEYWNRRPCNIRHSPKEVGTRDYFDEVEARKYFVEPHIPKFADFRRWKGKKVLEIGCGIGTDTINFARAGAKVTAVDLTENSLAVARQRAEVFGLSDRVNFYQANAERLSDYIPADTYDLVYSFGVIHHTPHPDRVLAQVRKFMNAESTLKLMVYYRYAWKVLWLLVRSGKCRFWRTSEIVAKNSEAQTGCPITYIYSKRQGRRLLQDAGFQVDDVMVDHIFPWRIRDYKEYRYTKSWYFRCMPGPLFRLLERRMGWHLCLTGRLDASRTSTAVTDAHLTHAAA